MLIGPISPIETESGTQTESQTETETWICKLQKLEVKQWNLKVRHWKFNIEHWNCENLKPKSKN